MMKILLVRHAQCEMNLRVSEFIGGRTNHSPLTPLGEQQAAVLGAHLRAELAHAGVPPARVRIYSSTAVRAVDTAQAVIKALQLDPSCLTTSEQLLELDQGEWQGLPRHECYTPQLTAAFSADPWGTAWHFTPPGGESQAQVEQRMLTYLTQTVLPGLQPGERAVVVSHGMAMKCALRGILHSLPTMSRAISTGNTSVSELGFVPRKPDSSGATSSGNGSKASSNGGGDAAEAVRTASADGGALDGRSSSPGPLGEGSWQLLRLNDLSHLSYDLRT